MRPTRHRALTGLVALCSLALLAPLARPLTAGKIFIYNDLSWFHLPMRYLFQQAMRSGDTVLWTPSIYAGLYVLGEGQTGLFHPLHQLLYRLFPLAVAFNLEMIANYVAAFAGMAWFLERLRFSRPAALFGAMLFAFCGFNLQHHQHLNLVAVVAHMPWLLAAADVVIVDDRRGAQTLGLIGVAGILASEILLGFPQAVLWNLLTLSAFSVYRCHETGRWRQLTVCALAIGLGILVGGVQLLPTADAVAHSQRMNLTDKFALTYSLHPYNFVQWWSPYFFVKGAYSEVEDMLHEFGVYSSAMLPLGLIWVWLRRRALPDRRGLVMAVTVFALVMMVLTLGSYGGAAQVFVHIPVLQALRAPARYIVLVQFALAILAALTLDDLLAIADGRHPPPTGSLIALWTPLALGVVTTIVFNMGLVEVDQRVVAGMWVAAEGVALVGVVSLLLYLAGRRVRWTIAGLVIVTAADLGMSGVDFVRRHGSSTILKLIGTIPPAPDTIEDDYAFVQLGGVISPNLYIMRGYRLTGGYVGLYPAVSHAVDQPWAMRLSGTRWFFTRDGVRHPFDHAVARARLLDLRWAPAPGTVQMVVDRPGNLAANVNVRGRTILAFTERFHRGWTATADGAALTMIRVDGDFLGCIVDAGVHRVTLQFMPRSFVYGVIVSCLGIMALALVAFARMRPRSTRSPAPDGSHPA
jgi:hypothetical protein